MRIEIVRLDGRIVLGRVLGREILREGWVNLVCGYLQQRNVGTW